MLTVKGAFGALSAGNRPVIETGVVLEGKDRVLLDKVTTKAFPEVIAKVITRLVIITRLERMLRSTMASKCHVMCLL